MFMPLLLSIVCAAQPVTFPDTAQPQGYTLERVQRAHDRLVLPPLDDEEFVLSDLHFRYKRRFTEYSGDISGRMLGALHATDKVLNVDTPSLNALLEAIPALQKADGHFGADQDLKKSVNQERDMPILWGNSRMLLALAEIYRDTHDEKLLEIAKRLGDYIVNTRDIYGRKENFNKVGGVFASGFTTCYPAFIDGMAALASVTGDKKYLDETRFIADLSLLDREFNNHHSHGRLTAYRGMLDLNAMTPVPDLMTAVVKGCETLTTKYVLPTGGVQELLEPTYVRDEGCSEADWIRVNALLWRETGDSKYLDAAEHAIRNHLYATQFFNGGFGHSFLRVLKDGDSQYLGGGFGHAGSESYWCCSMHCAQVLADIVRWGFASDGENIYVTWLAESSAEFPGCKITTANSGAGKWTVSVDAAKPVTLRLRVPAWAGKIRVNGEEQPAADGWTKVKVAGQTTLNVEFPETLRMAGWRTAEVKNAAPARIFAGPDLYALPDCALADGFIAEEAVPRIVFAADRPVNGAVPVLVEGDDGKTQRASLVPVADRPAGGCRVLFHPRKVAADDFAAMEAKAIPAEAQKPVARFAFCCSGGYVVYLNGKRLHEADGWQESPYIEAYAAPGDNILAVVASPNNPKPGIIGQIIFGDKKITTDAAWIASAVDGDPTPQMLTELPKTQPAQLDELGAFGTPPWNHFPAHFAATSAKWIWPKDAPAKSKVIFYCRF